MTMKALELVTREERENDDGYDWYSADPDVMYPAAIKYAHSLLVDGADVPMYLRQHVEKLRSAGMPAAAWEAAEAGDVDLLSPQRRAQRAEILEAARLIFTARLREQADGPIGLHILKSDGWRL